MTSKTVRQKFLYNVPHFNSGFPMVRLYNVSDLNGSFKVINFSFLCEVDLQKFKEFLSYINKTNVENIIIKNDLTINSNNTIIINSINHDILAFAYWFSKTDLKVAIQY